MRNSTFFGQFLVVEGLVTRAQLLAAVEHQRQFNSRLGEYAVALGCISRGDADRINAMQAEKDLMFGEAAVRLGLFDEDRLRELVKAQREEHIRLGEALIKLDYLNESQVQDAIERFVGTQKEGMVCEIPDDHALSDLALDLLQVTHHLLLRTWGLQNKPRYIQRRRELVLLSDRNAYVSLRGDMAGRAALGVPQDIAALVTEADAETEPEDDKLDAAVRELLRLVCDGLIRTMAEKGVELEATSPQDCGFCQQLKEGEEAIVFPYLTHHGQILALLVA